MGERRRIPPPIGSARPNSLTKMGPVGMIRRGDWQQSDSDLIAHFIQVVQQIASSRWRNSDCNYQVAGGEVIGSEFPDIEAFIYAASCIRQLVVSNNKSDQLYRRAVARYSRFVDSATKAAWASDQSCKFENMIKGPVRNAPDILNHAKLECSKIELIEAFLYGAGLFHGPPNMEAPPRKLMRFISEHCNQHLVVFRLHVAMGEIQNYASEMAAVIYQDFAHWFETENLPAPDIPWHYDLFSPSLEWREV